MKLSSSAPCLVIVILLAWLIVAKKADKERKNNGGSASAEAKLLNSLLRKYNNQLPPDTHNATQIQVFVHVNRISKIDNTEMVLTLDLHLKQQWFDKRLRYPAASANMEQIMRLEPDDAAKLWHPDSFFRNLVHANEFSLPSQQKLTFLYSSGRVYTSHRMEVTLYCPMSFHKYPFDKQICPVTIETHGGVIKGHLLLYLKNREVVNPRKANREVAGNLCITISFPVASNMGAVVLRWSPLYASAVELNADVGLTNHAVTQVLMHDCNKQNRTSSTFPCLEFELIIARNLGLYLKHVYIPQLLLICVCFLSFFIQTTLPRITLIIVCSITMVTHAATMTSQSMELPYYTALDVWVTVNFVFLFVVVLEFGLVAAPKRWLPQTETSGRNSPYQEGENGNGNPAHTEELMENHMGGRHQKYVLTDAPTAGRQRLDLMARFTIPLSYIGFNVAYWVYYCLL